MRMWKCDPKILCMQHLLGMHCEMHMFSGSLKSGYKIDGFLTGNCLEPLALKQMHDDCANELIRRGKNHKTPLDEREYQFAIWALPKDQLNYKIDGDESLKELITRCPKCNERYQELLTETN